MPRPRRLPNNDLQDLARIERELKAQACELEPVAQGREMLREETRRRGANALVHNRNVLLVIAEIFRRPRRNGGDEEDA
jgi:hypothetical protein